MSYETTLARAEAEQADRNWRGHRAHCPACDAAAGRRRWDELCHQGTGLRVIKRTADAELKRNRELDKQPAPDQGALFPMADDTGIVSLPHMEGCGLASSHRGPCRTA